jgi:acyl carrier protein
VEISREAQAKLAAALGGAGTAADDKTGGPARTAENAENADGTNGTVRSRVARIIEDSTGIDADEISDDADLTDDLHISSVSLIEIAIHIEDDLHIRVEEEDIYSAHSLADLVAFVEKAQAGKK